MGIYPKIMILPGCLLESDETGRLRPADYDLSGGALFGSFRLDAAKLVAQEISRFICIGSGDQTEYFKNELPGNRHLSVCNPDRFTKNTQGNIEQLRELVENFHSSTILLNLYYAWRWREWTGIQCLPAEAVLAAHYGWGYEELEGVYGTDLIARRLSDITLASAHRINTDSDGCLTESEFGMFDDIISKLPTSSETGPARNKVPSKIQSLAQSSYEKRFLDELCGVKDIRTDGYHSYV